MNNMPPTDGTNLTNDGQLVSPVPPNISPPFPAPWGAPLSWWIYRDEHGQILFLVCRFDGENGKTILPLTLWRKPDETLAWYWKGWPSPLIYSLFNLDQLASRPSARVLVVEGEKTAEAAAKLFPDLIVVTSPFGANSANKADWSRLKDREVTIWRDNDKPGRKYAADVCRLAKNAGASRVAVVDVPSDFPPKWDLADPLPDGYTTGDLRRLIDEAKEPSGDQLGTVPALPLIWFQSITPVIADFIELVERLVGVGQLSVIYGPSGSGKTFLVMDLALRIASGCPWFGRQVEPGGVIYVAAEGKPGIDNRVAAFRQYHGIGPDVKLPFAIVKRSTNLCCPPTDTEALISTINDAAAEIDGPVRLVIIDTLSHAMAGGNENSSDDMGALVANADRVREETGAHVMFIHHTGKDTTRGARGHSLLRAAVDTEIEVTRDEIRGISVARVTKQRELPIENALVFRLEVVELGLNQQGNSVGSCVVLPVDDAAVGKLSAGQERPLSAGTDRALSVLRDCIAEHGRIVEGVPYVPALPVVELREWYRALRQASVTSEDKPDSERSLRSRYRKELMAGGAIGISGDLVWLNEMGVTETGEIPDGPSGTKRDETPPKGGVSSSRVSPATGVVSGNPSLRPLQLYQPFHPGTDESEEALDSVEL